MSDYEVRATVNYLDADDGFSANARLAYEDETPDQWSVYKRDAEGLMMWVADYDTEAEARNAIPERK